MNRTTGGRVAPPNAAELLDQPERALDLSPADARELLLKLVVLVEDVRLAAGAPAQNGQAPEPLPRDTSGASDHWIRPDAAATIAETTRRGIYGLARRKDWRPFVRRLTRKMLQIEEHGLRAWLARR
jgi:hypothetical protein